MTTNDLIKKLSDIDVFAKIKKICKANKWWCISEKNKNYDVFIFGVRNANRDQSTDEFDDVIGFAYPLNAKIEVVISTGTTDPGRLDLVAPRFAEAKVHGTAIMAAGQYRGLWKLGWIGTGGWRHECLVQNNKVKLHRDNNRDEILDLDEKTAVEMHAGICLHGANLNGFAKKIGAFSAGCQVMNDFLKYRQLMEICKRQKRMGIGDTFSYTLFDEKDLI